jgi:hypothetical protein
MREAVKMVSRQADMAQQNIERPIGRHYDVLADSQPKGQACRPMKGQAKLLYFAIHSFQLKGTVS